MYVCVNKTLWFPGAPSEGASPGPVRRRVSDKSGVAIAGGTTLLLILYKNITKPIFRLGYYSRHLRHYLTKLEIFISNWFTYLYYQGLPYMLERAGLDVQQGKVLFFKIEP